MPKAIYLLGVFALLTIGVNILLFLRSKCQYDSWTTCSNNSQTGKLVISQPKYCAQTKARDCSSDSSSPSGSSGSSGSINPNCAHGTITPTGCTCRYGYTGDKCDHKKCFNGGNLFDGNCECPANFTGDFCQTPICVNGTIDGSQCLCKPKYFGDFCDKKCVNGTFANGICTCATGFTGPTCEQKNCLNGGVLNANNQCECAKGFAGNSCESPICQGTNSSNCVPHPLKNSLSFSLSDKSCFGNNDIKITLMSYDRGTGPNDWDNTGLEYYLCPNPTHGLSTNYDNRTRIRMLMTTGTCYYFRHNSGGIQTGTWWNCDFYLSPVGDLRGEEIAMVSDADNCLQTAWPGGLPVGLMDPTDCTILGGHYNRIGADGYADCHLNYCRKDHLFG